jgi:hypothetical protein
VAKNPPTSAFPKREQAPSPSSQGVAKQPPANAFPKREKTASAPSSQSTLTNIANSFPKRGRVAAPSSSGPQKRKKSTNALTNLIVGNGNEKPKAEAKPAPIPIQKEKVNEKHVDVRAEKVQAESRPKPKGFGKPAMKITPSQIPPPKIQLKEGMTAEEAEQAREARLSGEPEKADESAKSTPSQISPGMTADEAEEVRKARLSDEAEAVKKAWLGEPSKPTPDEPEKEPETAKKTSPKAAQVHVGTKNKFVRTNPPKEASSPKSVANALKDLAIGSSGKNTEPVRPLLNRGATSLSKLAASNQGGLKQPVQKATSPMEKKTLKDLLSKEKPIGSGRKTTSKLGGIASPEENPLKEKRQQAMKEEVLAAAAAAAPRVEKKPSPASAVVSSLSQLVKNGSSATQRPADALSRVEPPSSKLGGIAGEVEPSIKQQKVMNAAKPSAPAESTNDDAAPIKNADSDNASSKTSASQPAFSSLTDIVVGQERPALAQQNVGKRNSLFPAKKESRLSRLLKK